MEKKKRLISGGRLIAGPAIGLTLGVLALTATAAPVKAPAAAPAGGSVSAEPDVPEVVDPDEAARALAAGIAPTESLSALKKTAGAKKAASPEQAASEQPRDPNAPVVLGAPAGGAEAAADADEDPIAKIAEKLSQESSETHSGSAPGSEKPAAEVKDKDSAGGSATPVGETGTASEAKGAESTPPAAQSEYGEENPEPRAVAAATWSEEVKAKTKVKELPPLGDIPAFLGVKPYVTKKADVEALFKGKVRYADDGPLGPRHVVTGDDFMMGAQSLLIGYTADGVVSDMYLQIPAVEVDRARSALKGLTAKMSPEGLWIRRSGEHIWRTRTTEMELSPDADGGMTVLYGAVARQQWETRHWLDADPNNRYPRFAGLLIGRSTLDEVVGLLGTREGCSIGTPAVFPNGSFAVTLTGNCFSLPKEERSDLWFDADTHRLVRLVINTGAAPEDMEAVEQALARRYSATDEPGVYQVGTSPARNVWLPRLKVTPAEGRLEVDVPVDGLTSTDTNWIAIQKADQARRKEAARIDRLFD